MYFEDGVDEAILVHGRNATLRLFPGKDGKLAASGDGEYSMQLMHPTTVETSTNLSTVSGEATSGVFYANDDTALSYEDADGKKLIAKSGGSARVNVTSVNHTLNLSLKGNLVFTEEKSR